MSKDYKLVVRLSIDYFKQGDSYVAQKKLRCLKNLSTIGLEAHGGDERELFEDIVNLDNCKPGLYEVRFINMSFDVETGVADSWDLELIPYEEEVKQ